MRVLTAAILGVLAALCGVSLHPATAAPAAGCTVRHELARTAAQLHADPDTITVGRTPRIAWGITIPDSEYRAHVIVSTKAPCWAVPSIVRHEWMHQQQFSYFGAAHMPADTEIEADCGSWMLGSSFTPYITRARHDGSAGCTEDIAIVARYLIERAGARPVRSL